MKKARIHSLEIAYLTSTKTFVCKAVNSFYEDEYIHVIHVKKGSSVQHAVVDILSRSAC